MDHKDHVSLLRPADLPPGASYADLGAGSGAFTLALRELLGLSADIYAVDRDRGRLSELEKAHRARFGTSDHLHLIPADFARELDLPPLDSVLMANSLHFFRDKEKILRHAGSFLKPGGVLLLVEYNVDRGNPWVPHPLSFETFRELVPAPGSASRACWRSIRPAFCASFILPLHFVERVGNPLDGKLAGYQPALHFYEFP